MKDNRPPDLHKWHRVPSLRPERGWSIGTKLLVLTLPLIAAVTAVAVWAVQTRNLANLQEKLTQRARSLHTQIMADRKYYTSVILPRAIELGGSVGADYKQVHGRFPLPATFVREVSELTAIVREGYAANLISPWAINPDKGVKDQFQRDAFAYLMEHPTGQFVRIDTVEGQAVMRVLMGDRVSVQSCADCHNAHPKSPRHDFKLNDLMGGLEIVIPIDQYLNESRRDLALTVVGGAGLFLLLVGIVVLGARRTVTRPLGKLAEKMRLFARSGEGRVTRADAVPSGDEVARLEETFETMKETVAYQENELRDANARLEQRVAERTDALQSLVEAARQFTAEPRLERLLQQLIETARRLTGGRYAALGIFDETGEHLVQLLTVGMDEATKEAIGGLPSGRGLLGHLAHEEGVLRLKDLTQHPASVGFPPHHPPMRSFLGVSIRARGRLYGRLYVTDKQGADEFTALDEQAIAGLAAQAGVAIENAYFIKDIRTSREQYRATMASLPISVVRLGKGLTIRFANRAFCDLVHQSPEDTMGRSIGAVLPVKGLEEYLQTMLATHAGGGIGAEREFECAMPTGGSTGLTTGDRLVLRLSVSGIRRADDDDDDDDDDIVLAIEDMTERKQLEAQFRQAQKMETVGRLAGGVAHDFNNLLTVITGYSEMLLSALPPDDPSRSNVEQIRQAGARAAALTNQLLAFSRKQVLQPKVLGLNVVVANVVQMLQRLVGEDIDLITTLAPDVGPMRADPGQLEQVIMNLAVNARDAMPRGGTLTIRTADADVDRGGIGGAVPIPPGPYVVLTVSDTGCGMDAETQAHIFEPFFTTKGLGKGTGLGLATVYGIVKQSGGYITVASELEHGTTFTLYFPRVEAASEASEAGPALTRLSRSSETILLVEDEAGVRALLRSVLETAGYRVLEAWDGHEALRIAGEHSGLIQLLITDVVMPDMSGREMVERLTPVRPEMKVLYMSGYTDDAVLRHGVLAPGTVFLQKPFPPEALARKVREVLDQS